LACLEEAVTLFLEECKQMGSLEMVLEEAGYQLDPARQQWVPRQPVQVNRLEASLA
jgi:hypothetical protein